MLHNFIVVEYVTGNRRCSRGNLDTQLLIYAAINGIEQCFGKVSAGSEKLHLLTDPHCGYAAGNSVIIAINRAHDVVVLVLDGAGLNRYLRAIILKALR
ncbi:hypothetical protein D3C77_674830 [compost metagenome]